MVATATIISSMGVFFSLNGKSGSLTPGKASGDRMALPVLMITSYQEFSLDMSLPEHRYPLCCGIVNMHMRVAHKSWGFGTTRRTRHTANHCGLGTVRRRFTLEAGFEPVPSPFGSKARSAVPPSGLCKVGKLRSCQLG